MPYWIWFEYFHKENAEKKTVYMEYIYNVWGCLKFSSGFALGQWILTFFSLILGNAFSMMFQQKTLSYTEGVLNPGLVFLCNVAIWGFMSIISATITAIDRQYEKRGKRMNKILGLVYEMNNSWFVDMNYLGAKKYRHKYDDDYQKKRAGKEARGGRDRKR